MSPTLFDLFFYLFGATVVLSAALVAFTHNIVRAAFSLLFTFLGIAGVYVLLSADFVAVSQILIYVGGILVLLVFGVMLTNRVTQIDLKAALRNRVVASVLIAVLAALVVPMLVDAHWMRFDEAPWRHTPWGHDALASAMAHPEGAPAELAHGAGSTGTSSAIGLLLMSDQLLPFELLSIVLLVALVGAAMIARQDGVARTLRGVMGKEGGRS